MCRLYGFISNEQTKVDCSLVYAQNALMLQSRVDEIGLDHTDGWGIATYHDGKPQIQKKITAAYDDELFSITAETTYSNVMVAHVRRATVGVNSIENTHPFVEGHWTFAHNGTLSGFDQIRSQLEAETALSLQANRKGTTDSEQYFLWLLSRLKAAGVTDPSLMKDEDLVSLLLNSVSRLDEMCRHAEPEKTPRLNFVLTDGATLIACRWNHNLHRINREGIYECEICGIPHIHQDETVNHRAIAIASEPVTHETWEEVSNQSIVVARVS